MISQEDVRKFALMLLQMLQLNNQEDALETLRTYTRNDFDPIIASYFETLLELSGIKRKHLTQKKADGLQSSSDRPVDLNLTAADITLELPSIETLDEANLQ